MLMYTNEHHAHMYVSTIRGIVIDGISDHLGPPNFDSEFEKTLDQRFVGMHPTIASAQTLLLILLHTCCGDEYINMQFVVCQ